MKMRAGARLAPYSSSNSNPEDKSVAQAVSALSTFHNHSIPELADILGQLDAEVKSLEERMKAAKEALGEAWVTAHSKVSPVTTFRITVRRAALAEAA